MNLPGHSNNIYIIYAVHQKLH